MIIAMINFLSKLMNWNIIAEVIRPFQINFLLKMSHIMISIIIIPVLYLAWCKYCTIFCLTMVIIVKYFPQSIIKLKKRRKEEIILEITVGVIGGTCISTGLHINDPN